uniref:Phytanoyl-CoA dioxygenase n=1 Tax=Chromera velia CCMP2878 TaxID=1169474 RepID=A0A0G4GR61_9ALVE|eukprot:Cvel_23018.t1-p1 / transcript=Cvel_23018.t1 / gene=Cvel_23018 / organism=Chromera_velia_CCMP2878 / gene_product=Uncharacterized protein Mb3657, putative / transcript_product=Uncharacterized protein Mb3657, putative / location=Cvel_scaffold2324:17000-18561(-) / protein_length=304 / sequence_SO=supercontig / SO=protein_coding / is_pseudo=false
MSNPASKTASTEVSDKQYKTSRDVQRAVDLIRQDLSSRHRMYRPPAVVDSEQLARDVATVERDGYIIFENLFTPRQMKAMADSIEDYMRWDGRNNFEGHKTRRVYSIAGKTVAFDPLIEHPRVMALLNYFLLPNFLLSMAQVIRIYPHEKPQILHIDDGFIPFPRPRKALGAATIWAIDDFTEANGSTVVWPQSHLWGEGATPENPPEGYSLSPVSVKMPAGSCVFFLSTLWHGGGRNETEIPRTAFTTQYCEPFLRTQENQFLAVSKEMARKRSDAMKSMLGYSVHPPFIGQVDGMSPMRSLL